MAHLVGADEIPARARDVEPAGEDVAAVVAEVAQGVVERATEQEHLPATVAGGRIHRGSDRVEHTPHHDRRRTPVQVI